MSDDPKMTRLSSYKNETPGVSSPGEDLSSNRNSIGGVGKSTRSAPDPSNTKSDIANQVQYDAQGNPIYRMNSDHPDYKGSQQELEDLAEAKEAEKAKAKEDKKEKKTAEEEEEEQSSKKKK